MTMNLGRFITSHAQEFPAKSAITVGDCSLTYPELELRTTGLAGGFAGLGLGRGDVVAAVLENCVEMPELFFACAKAGTVLAPMVTRRVDDEIDALVAKCGARVLVVGPDHRDRVAAMRAAGMLAGIATVVEIGPPPTADGVLAYEDLVASGAGVPLPVGVGDDDPVILFSTGGTTGLPKLGVHTHATVLQNHYAFQWNIGFRPQDVCLHPMPPYHASILVTTLTHMIVGASTIVTPKFDPTEFLSIIDRERVSYVFLMPPVLFNWLVDAGIDDYDLSSITKLFVPGGNFFNRDVVAKYLPDTELFYLYSQTENTTTCLLRGKDIFERRQSVGRLDARLEWRLVDDEDRDVPPDTPGELLLRGASVIPEYFADPEETARAWRGGWFHTGDMLRRDPDGYFYFEGRGKEVIKTGGENVYAVRVESVLVEHPAVREVAVVGAHDEKWGERVCACVVPAEGAAVDPSELIAFCRGKLAGFEIPKTYHLIDALPVNPVGKILKRELTARIDGGELGQVGAA
ncbi:long-chain fatty acid--CoA ligase [Pseudonocardia petroleophila]|uniref:Acyl--CoA ligase n=1 Tax=Pseudonocardia petroleophila TaxID=37331 RepID=A0A7G7MC05_9PSEU|nr:class I adenylate-forming enzyme family protein [Pseudonocardia petroleophila]QNG50316.1 acyl--CoA ligase [Pseudonocardia petroleophila]